MDVVLSGHAAQLKAVGDDRLWRRWKNGVYGGGALNRCPKGGIPGGPHPRTFVQDTQLFMREFEDVAMLLQPHRLDDGHDRMSPEERGRYRFEADEFMRVTRAMADLRWTPEQHRWLARRNRTFLASTEAGRKELERFQDAPILMTTRQVNKRGEDSADQFNARRLEELSRSTNTPILSIRASHDKSKEAVDMKCETMKADEFKGLKAAFDVCEGVRVLLTSNEWVEAGLMNGAIGVVKGFMYPEGFDPNSSNPEVRGPICVFVEFEDVDLGTDEQGRPRSYFPDEPEKRKWIPIYRETAYSVSEQDVCRKQFPLTLAWALTHWKA